MNTQKLPAGLVDDNLEFFTDPDGFLKALYKGQVIPFNEVPRNVRIYLEDEMAGNEDVIRTLEAAGIELLDDQLYVYAKCFYGGFNHEPDFTPTGAGAHDNHACGMQCQCVLKPIVKEALPVAHGALTERELEVTKLLTHSYLTKQIADALRISPATVDKHKRNIFRKTGLHSNVEVAVWAANNNLL